MSFIHAYDSVISFSTSSTQDTIFKTRLLQLECHFTWALNKNDTDLTNLLNRLEEQLNLALGGEAGVARTYSCMGFVKFLLGSNTEALSNCERSVELTKSRGDDCDKLLVVVYGDLAWLYYHKGNFTDCESYLNKLSEIKGKYPSVPYAEVLGEKGWTFLKFSGKYYERAKECFEKALELEPEEGEWNAGLAIVLYRIENMRQDSAASTETSTDQLRRAIAMNPDDDVLKVLLGLRLVADKKFSEAESLVEQALERSPEHPHVIRYVGKFLRNQGSVNRSIALLKRALEKVSNASFIHHQLGLCYKKKIHTRGPEIEQDREQCIYHLEMAIKLNTTFITAMSDLALQYGVKRDMQRAEEMFQNAFQTAKEKNDSYQYIRLRYAEFQQYSMKCEPAAIEHYTECLKINPNTYHGKKSAESLKKIAKRRIENNPEDGEAFGILGIIHKEKGEKQQAIECFEKALSCEDNEDYLSDLCELRLSLQ